jgi:1,4-dihydroxy-2-naphthoate octaprenyltransferase
MNIKGWLKQGKTLGAGPLKFRITNSFWLLMGAAILVMLFQSLWTWAIVLGVIAIVLGIAYSQKGT